MEENLNLEQLRKDLVIKALNRERSYEAAAKVLGISRRTVARDIKVYNIQKLDGQFQAIDNKK